MTTLKRSLAAAVLAALVTVGALWRLQRERNWQGANLRAENGRLLLIAEQRLAAAQPAATVPRGSQANPSRPAQPELRGIAPSRAYRDEGAATPKAALQTFAFACDRADVAKVKTLIAFEPDARAKAEAFFASLPSSARQAYASVEDLAATVFVSEGMHHPFPSTEVLDLATTTPLSPNRVQVDLSDTPLVGLIFENEGGAWKRIITAAMVDGYLSRRAR